MRIARKRNGAKQSSSETPQNVSVESDDLVELNAVGAESEEDVSANLRAEISKAVLWATDWTIETIHRQLQKGNIELNPEFQRREAWDDTKKSRFIESILLGFPIPQIVLAERKNKPGAYVVIDGKQRLLSIRRFFASGDDSEFRPFSLTGLTVRTDLNGYSHAELGEDPSFADEIRFFENQTVRTTIIRNWPTENFLYTVFHRLNTGSVPLSPQELRQALHPGPFLTFANRFTADSTTVPLLLGRTTPDFRMRDVELFVRFYAFRYFLSEYRGNLKQFLDDTCETLNRRWIGEEEAIRQDGPRLEHAIEVTLSVFGRDGAFRKWADDAFEPRFNRAVYDVMVYFFADVNAASVRANAGKIRTAFQELCATNADFIKSVETTTKSLEATGTRFELWGRALARILGRSIKVPGYKDRRITTR